MVVAHVAPSAEHPLIPSADTGNVTIRNRPRFTLAEAITLNMIVNAGTDGVAIRQIQDVLGMVSPFGRPHRMSILHRVSQLRAKIGEPKNNPIQIVNVYSLTEPLKVIGFRWVEQES